MGNPQHLEWLLEGVEAWNARRRREPFVPDLWEMDVRKAFRARGMLDGDGRIPLSGANLGGANLERANLGGAYMRTVYSAVGTNDGWTAEYTNLRVVIGLTQDQLDLAQGDTGVLLPEGFRHPAHWPDPAPPEDPAPPPPDAGEAPAREAPFAFLSYASDDREMAEAVLTLLKAEDLPFWWDQHMLADRFRAKIREKLETSRAVLVLWTDASVTSEFVAEEADHGRKTGKLVHARMDDANVPLGFGEINWMDLRLWDGTVGDRNFQKLILALKAKLDPENAAEIEARIVAGNPLEGVTQGRKLAAKDSPANAAPVKDDPDERDARLEGLWQTVSRVQNRIGEAGQIPKKIVDAVHDFDGLRDEVPNWFALEDARDGLLGALAEHEDMADIHEAVFKNVHRICERVTELKPFLYPTQPEPGAPRAKPVQIEPVVRADDAPEIIAKMLELGNVFDSPEAHDAIDPGFLAFLRDAVEDTLLAARDMPVSAATQDARARTLRRSVKKLTYGIAAITTAVRDGVISKLVSAKAALETLSARLQPFFDWLLKFF